MKLPHSLVTKEDTSKDYEPNLNTARLIAKEVPGNKFHPAS